MGGISLRRGNFEAKSRRRRDSTSGGKVARLPPWSGEAAHRLAPRVWNCSAGRLCPIHSAVRAKGPGREGVRAAKMSLFFFFFPLPLFPSFVIGVAGDNSLIIYDSSPETAKNCLSSTLDLYPLSPSFTATALFVSKTLRTQW